MYGFDAEQVALVAVVWTAASSAALVREIGSASKRPTRPADKRSTINRIGSSCAAGFLAVAYLGAFGLTVGNQWISDHRFYVACFAPIVGLAGPEQQALLMNTVLEIGTRITKKRDDA